MAGYRLATGGALIDRAASLRFRFDDRAFSGFAGDSLASALLAAGEQVLGRSFKYHRPRGLVAAGTEEPNALVTLGMGARREPNLPATTIRLADGLVATGQNAWPSLRFDLQAVNGLAAPLLGAGFYYKTFMGPNLPGLGIKPWMFFEKFIRRAAGMGRGGTEADPDHYEKLSGFCDLLVVGAGLAGLAAASLAARTGARVILCDESADVERRQGPTGLEIDGLPARDWTLACMAELRALENVTVLSDTVVYGKYDGGQYGAVERLGPEAQARQRHWILNAGQVILATGAIERPLVFKGNDLPGVMLADAVRRYGQDYGIAAGRRVTLMGNNDSLYPGALALAAAGVPVLAVADSRSGGGERWRKGLKAAGIEHYQDIAACRAWGRGRLQGLELVSRGGARIAIDTDCLGTSGGWNPAIHLASQNGEKPVFDKKLQTFLAAGVAGDMALIGAAAGCFEPKAALGQALACLRERGLAGANAKAPEVGGTGRAINFNPAAEFLIPPLKGRGKIFVDMQHDVTLADIELARTEGFVAVEHLKRYTTLGMAGDQGKTSNIAGLGLMARARGITLPEVGTTRFRPPYTPIALGALAGEGPGAEFRPTRKTPMHAWHLAQGAEMIAVGLWQRPRVYRRSGESLEDGYIREATQVRAGVGIVDVTTLGKIDVLGPDAAEFLNRVYVNGFAKMPVGKARYGVMLREDGLVFDDGTTWRLGPQRYLMTTTTANAAGVLAHLEHLLTVIWPALKVHVASVSDQWAAAAVAGPKSQNLLQKAVADVDFDEAAFPQMAVRSGHLGEVAVWLARLSFSGERAYEVYAPWHQGEAMWRALIEAGGEFGLVPYGTEAMGTLRIEKGHVAGPELDGRTSLRDLRLERMASRKKHFIGEVLAQREALEDPMRQTLVGLQSEDATAIPVGAHLVDRADAANPGKSQGVVTSVTYSPAMAKPIALGLLAGGRSREGEKLYAADPIHNRHVAVQVVSPHFYDPEGERLNA